ncbi:toll/interleukin-1 receptor domain-containing protein [Cupriavidus alkaliphilus]|uniref:toll/interleukin-1 receptor domain-containing protein n=1 Tax=Cupriavidus alkaliphilus TaxID=942866 RepID=UPI0017970059|nr:toll/interleukin-1 receptor domain-containing protein [Cupriavidus alkaliphilus]MBB2918185.1 hypothetical protein [Cupriavidus alkaliphilus]
MAPQLIFLSHIHEERELAVLLKKAIETEFGGFARVFVSSDGESIPAGANFLEAIETGLIDCAAALYLISPQSVRRPWINFELGAVWSRGAVAKRQGGSRLFAVPICHSGAFPSTLPVPLNNLNGIEASKADRLEFAFVSLQCALGGSGPLRTNFNDLAAQIQTLEAKYTAGVKLVRLFATMQGQPHEIRMIVEQCEKLAPHTSFGIDLGPIPRERLESIREAAAPLGQAVQIVTERAGMYLSGSDSYAGSNVKVMVACGVVAEFGHMLLST